MGLLKETALLISPNSILDCTLKDWTHPPNSTLLFKFDLMDNHWRNG